MFFSSLPQSDGKSSSLPSDLSELMVLGPKNTLLTPLVIGLQTKTERREIFKLSQREIQDKITAHKDISC